MANLAPIVLFSYCRLNQTKKTVTALQKNELADQSDLIVFSDGWKNQFDKPRVLEVRRYLQTIEGFRSISVIEREKNFQLDNNVVAGVTDVVNRYGKVVVLEDDIETSPAFLIYMNNALNYFEDKKEVWHISGWNVPIKSKGLGNSFFTRLMNCWGWATWSDRWQHFNTNIDEMTADFADVDIRQFNLDCTGTDFWGQIIVNKNKVMKNWDICWYTTIFTNRGLCLNPTRSYVRNIGFGDGATNTKEGGEHYAIRNLNKKKQMNFDIPIQEHKKALYRIQRFYTDLYSTKFLATLYRFMRSKNKWKKLKIFANKIHKVLFITSISVFFLD